MLHSLIDVRILIYKALNRNSSSERVSKISFKSLLKCEKYLYLNGTESDLPCVSNILELNTQESYTRSIY